VLSAIGCTYPIFPADLIQPISCEVNLCSIETWY